MAKQGSILLNSIDLPYKKIKAIVDTFKDLNDISKCNSVDLGKVGVLNRNDVERVLGALRSDFLKKELELIKKEGIRVIDIFDEDYPYLLRQIASPPLVLYIKGDAAILNEFLFAVVGSRIHSKYGASMSYEFSSKLASLGMVVVSGLAKGIDSFAHRGALDAGKTIAVLGSGLLNVYPRENRRLASEIKTKGAVVSEFPLLASPLRENFPRRNRIVSGLSKGVLVVEAALRSGALITARLACEQNREVFAIPGNVGSNLSNGTNKLIKEGAKLVCDLEDILEELNYGKILSNC